MGIHLSQEMGVGVERGAFVELICTAIAVGARTECGLDCVGYGCGQGRAGAMLSAFITLTCPFLQTLSNYATLAVVEQQNSA